MTINAIGPLKTIYLLYALFAVAGCSATADAGATTNQAVLVGANASTAASNPSCPPREPVALKADIVGNEVFYTVPAGKIFVIEFVGVSGLAERDGLRGPAALLVRPKGVNTVLAGAQLINEAVLEIHIPLAMAALADSVRRNNKLVATELVAGHVSTRVYAHSEHDLIGIVPGVESGAAGSTPGLTPGSMTLSGYLTSADCPALAP